MEQNENTLTLTPDAGSIKHSEAIAGSLYFLYNADLFCIAPEQWTILPDGRVEVSASEYWRNADLARATPPTTPAAPDAGAAERERLLAKLAAHSDIFRQAEAVLNALPVALQDEYVPRSLQLALAGEIHPENGIMAAWKRMLAAEKQVAALQGEITEGAAYCEELSRENQRLLAQLQQQTAARATAEAELHRIREAAAKQECTICDLLGPLLGFPVGPFPEVCSICDGGPCQHPEQCSRNCLTAPYVAEELAAEVAKRLATAEAEAAGLREGLALYLPQLIQKPFIPSDPTKRPDFVEGINVAIDMQNHSVLATANLLGIELELPTPAQPTPPTPIHTSGSGERQEGGEHV